MPPSAWAVFIYATCMVNLKPVEEMGIVPPIPHLDKLVHLTYYSIFSMLILRGWQREKMPPLGLHLLVWTMCFVFGAMIEVNQGFTTYRSFEVADMIANGIGALIGQTLWHAMMIRWGKRTKLYPGLFRPDFKTSPANSGNREIRGKMEKGN